MQDEELKNLIRRVICISFEICAHIPYLECAFDWRYTPHIFSRGNVSTNWNVLHKQVFEQVTHEDRQHRKADMAYIDRAYKIYMSSDSALKRHRI